jgi:adenosylcobyric acid synthase
VEDSLALEGRPESPAAAGGQTLEVAVVRLRWLSNFTDADALSGEPGVRVRFTRSAADIERADLVVLPGTKATLEDLELLRDEGLDRVLAARARAGDPLLGVCGGYQILGERIEDDVESRRGAVAGLGLLPVRTRFEADKLLRRRTGFSPWARTTASGYEIRHGRVQRTEGLELLRDDDGEGDGCVRDAVLGTSWHGVLEDDGFRRGLLAWVARRRRRTFTPGTTPFANRRTQRLDALGALVADHLDGDALTALIEQGPPPGLPIIDPEVSACSAS